MLSHALAAAGIRPAFAGSPHAGRAPEIAGALSRPGLSVEPVSDLRAALSNAQVDLAILADPGDFADSDHDTDDLGALHAARSRGVRVLTFEPMPTSVLQLDTPRLDPDDAPSPDSTQDLLAAAGVRLGPGSEPTPPVAVQTSGQAAALTTLGGWAAFAMPLRLAAPMRSVTELVEHVGPVLACSVECLGLPHHGSLGARIFDAADTLVSLMGTPESVHAAYVPWSRGRGVHSAPGHRLRTLDGSLTANMRFADGRSAAIVASSRAGAFERTITLLCEKGQVRLRRQAARWLGPSGEPEHADTPAGDAPCDEPEDLSALKHMLALMTDKRLAPPAPTDYARVLSVTGAALLSARTGEGESPSTIARMARGG